MWSTLITLWLTLSDLVSRKPSPHRPAFRRPSARPRVEALEDRTVLSSLVTVSNVAVPGLAGNTVSNSGTWQDTTVGATATLTASYGSVTQNGNGTWTWSGTVPSVATPVVIYNQDNQAGSATADFWLGVGQVFTVNTTDDTAAANLTTGQDSNGNISLRSAIQAVNHAQSSTPALIGFDILNTDSRYQSATNSFRIQPQTALDLIASPVIIDGYTQPGASMNTLANGNNAALKIELRGNSSLATGLELHGAGSNGSIIKGLAVNSFSGKQIDLNASNNDSIQGNFIGLDATGNNSPVSLPNYSLFVINGQGTGVNVEAGSQNDVIGTNGDGVNDPGERNVISACRAGVNLSGASSNNVVAGNFIGTDANGTQGLGNYYPGKEVAHVGRLS